jgi:MoaA/NifB/PqqE/SkfB family radical SAM enzyme
MMFTNGMLLTKEMVRGMKEAGIFSVMVSLDSPVEEEHDAMRGCPGLFSKAVEGIKNLLEEDILVGISTYASHQNLKNGQILEMMELGKELGIHELTVFDSVPTGEYLRNCECILTPQEKEELRRLTEQWREDPDYPLCITMAWINSPQGSGCFAANEQFYMTAWGDIGPCDFTPLTFGNIREEPLSAIWQRMLSHPAYCDAHQQCRMQDPQFRKQYIDTIPEGARLPVEVWKDPDSFKPAAEGDFKPSGKSKKTAMDVSVNQVGF